jgi:hypothetical protein
MWTYYDKETYKNFITKYTEYFDKCQIQKCSTLTVIVKNIDDPKTQNTQNISINAKFKNVVHLQ